MTVSRTTTAKRTWAKSSSRHSFSMRICSRRYCIYSSAICCEAGLSLLLFIDVPFRRLVDDRGCEFPPDVDGFLLTAFLLALREFVKRAFFATGAKEFSLFKRGEVD